MARKRSLRADVDRRTERKGSATKTPGLTSLDQEREASMADEGGAAGAVVETQDKRPRRGRAGRLAGK